MTIQERLYTVDDVWQLEHQPENEGKHYYLINGELFWEMSPGYFHGRLAILIGRYLSIYAEEHDLGEVTAETGFYPDDDRHTLLMPDVAFIRKEKTPPATHEKFVHGMPDLAVEISSPSNSLSELRRKAVVYLANGTELIWLVLPGAGWRRDLARGARWQTSERVCRARWQLDWRADLTRLRSEFAAAFPALEFRLLRGSHRITTAQKIEIATQRRLIDMPQVHLSVAALVCRRRSNPPCAASRQFLVADLQVQAALRHIQLDNVPVFNQRQRTAQRAFRRHMQDDGAVGGAAHARIGDPDHIAHTLFQQLLRDGQITDFGHAGSADGTGVLQHQHMIFRDLQRGIVHPRLEIRHIFEDDGRSAMG